MPSFSQRTYARFIPREEVGAVTQWKFSAVDGSDLVEPEAEPALELNAQETPEMPEEVIDEAALQAQQELIDQAIQEGFARGLAQGQEDTALEWQQRMDDYVANQGHQAAERLQAVIQSLDASLADVQQLMAQQVLALACDIARQVVRQELTVNTQVLQPVVREAVSMLVSEGRPATVRLNPADLEGVDDSLREALNPPGVQWLADPAVSEGGCLVESAGAVVDGTIEKRWQRAVAALGLESPWQEAEHVE